MELEILSTEFIKPSSPTPSHLKIHKLSSLDQTISHHYIPMYFLYQNPNTLLISPQERRQLLKSSLSRLLTLFYPFAGTITDQFSVLCDDSGVPFTHAVAKFPLFNFLQSPDLPCLPKLRPVESDGNGLRTDIAMVQVTDFSCGGFSISTLVSHAVADGASTAFFLKSWATLCRESDSSLVTTKLRPNFSASLLFPPADHVPDEARMVPMWDPFVKQGKPRVRRLVFGPSAILALKEKAKSQTVPIPTRVEVVLGQLSKCIISALAAKSGCKNGVMVSQIVNLRRKAERAFPEGSIGNYLWAAVMQREGEKGNELADLVSELRKATNKIDSHFVERMRAMGPEKLFEELGKRFPGAATGSEFIQLSSLCNFGWYEIDFGWGKPVWACGIGPPAAPATEFMNLVVLTDTRSGDGVEALVTLDEENFALFERSQELLVYAAFDQSPVSLPTNLHKNLIHERDELPAQNIQPLLNICVENK